MNEEKKKERHKVAAAVYIILRKDDQVLLMRRVNTGYCDGCYSLPSGHIEAGEMPEEAAVREAKEEVGVKIQDLRITTVIYTDDNYVCFFFEAGSWEGEVKNCEEDKCDDLNWFDLKALPENIAPEIRLGLENYQKKEYYSSQIIK